MEKAKKSVEQMAKEANGRSRSCFNCSLRMTCNMEAQKRCLNAFVEGFVKGYKKAMKG